MDHKPRPYRPGDLILDRYLPTATVGKREEARENLREYAKIVVGIAQRLVREENERAREILGELRALIEFESP